MLVGIPWRTVVRRDRAMLTCSQKGTPMNTSRRLKYCASLLMWATAATPASGGPAYTDSGALIVPSGYREWVFMSSGIDMSYTEKPAMEGASLFDNVFVDPVAWAAFQRTGHWPDKTMFALEIRGAKSKGSINQRGQYQSEERMGLEFHVRDEARFKGGWGFFAVNEDGTAPLLPAEAPCYACHQAHGAVDTTFTQFYPLAKPIAEKAGSYRKD